MTSPILPLPPPSTWLPHSSSSLSSSPLSSAGVFLFLLLLFFCYIIITNLIIIILVYGTSSFFSSSVFSLPFIFPQIHFYSSLHSPSNIASLKLYFFPPAVCFALFLPFRSLSRNLFSFCLYFPPSMPFPSPPFLSLPLPLPTSTLFPLFPTVYPPLPHNTLLPLLPTVHAFFLPSISISLSSHHHHHYGLTFSRGFQLVLKKVV